MRAAITLLEELGVHRESIAYVLNRSTRRSEIRAADVQSLFSGYEMIGEIPADFRALQPYMNTGTLIADSAPGQPVSRALRKLAHQVAERVPVARAA
jgi:Flp pilus assembly CpaE family ATPase